MSRMNFFLSNENNGNFDYLYASKWIKNNTKFDPSKTSDEEMNEFINTKMTDEQYRKMMTSIRQERSRFKKRSEGESTKQMTINMHTQNRLSRYASSYNITLSEAIEKLLNRDQELARREEQDQYNQNWQQPQS